MVHLFDVILDAVYSYVILCAYTFTGLYLFHTRFHTYAHRYSYRLAHKNNVASYFGKVITRW